MNVYEFTLLTIIDRFGFIVTWFERNLGIFAGNEFSAIGVPFEYGTTPTFIPQTDDSLVQARVTLKSCKCKMLNRRAKSRQTLQLYKNRKSKNSKLQFKNIYLLNTGVLKDLSPNNYLVCTNF